MGFALGQIAPDLGSIAIISSIGSWKEQIHMLNIFLFCLIDICHEQKKGELMSILQIYN